jgi:hypothetical protein
MFFRCLWLQAFYAFFYWAAQQIIERTSIPVADFLLRFKTGNSLPRSPSPDGIDVKIQIFRKVNTLCCFGSIFHS